MTYQHTGRQSLPRRFLTAIVNEFTPPPRHRPTPSDKEFAAGHLAVGTINDALEEPPGQDVQGPDRLVISAEIPGHRTLYRQKTCPLEMPGSGRSLVGQTIGFRHTTFDPDYGNDILVVRWPREVRRALEPIRYEGPGSLRARLWGGLSGLSFAVMWAGIMLTPILLCNLIVGSLAGSNMLADILPQVHPAIALGISIVVIPAGLFLYCFCATRRDAPLPGQHGNPRNRKNEQPKPDGADRSPGGH